MSPTIVNPSDLHDPTGFGYSHTADTTGGELVVVAGQYASDTTGHTVSDDFDTQVARSFENLGTALAAVGLGFEHVVRLGTYIVDHNQSKLEAVVREVAARWDDHPPAQTLIGVAALALPDMQFEVDALAVHPSAATP